MKSIVVLFIGFTILYSCSKDVYTEGHSITEIAKSKPAEYQELSKMRMSFAKIVALAFENKEFRSYFKNHFGTLTKEFYYEERVFGKHANDKVLQDGTTLKDLLKSIRDTEVISIYGNGIIDKILKEDPLISIKLPDLFQNFDWNTDKAAPMVIAVVPEIFSNAQFIGYHFCNDSKSFITGTIPQVFHVYVKKADDHIIVDKKSLFTQNGYELFEYLPQIKNCPSALNKVIGESNPYHTLTDYIYLNKKKAFKLWRETCGFRGSYTKTDGCAEKCPRKCNSLQTSPTVLDQLLNENTIFLRAEQSLAFRESFTLHGQFRIYSKKQFLGSIAIPSIRFSEFQTRKFTVKLLSSRLSQVPKMNITLIETPQTAQPIMIQYVISNSSAQEPIAYDFGVLHYGDIEQNVQLNPDFVHEEQIIVHPERSTPFNGGVIEYCDKAINDQIGAGCILRYRY